MRIGEVWRRLGRVRKREEFARDLDEEMRLHIDLRARRLGSASAARRQFGNRTAHQEESTEMWGWTSVERLAQDLRLAARTLLKTPGFTSVAVLTLALGLGVNSAVFSVVNAVILRRLPYADPSRLVALAEQLSDGGLHVVAPANLADYERGTSFRGLAGYDFAFKNLTGTGSPERICGESVTANFFSLLGVAPKIGRTFSEEEDRPGGEAVVVVTDDFWRRRMGSDAEVLQRSIRLDGLAYRIIGVLPGGFQSPGQLGTPDQVEFYVPAAYSKELLASRGDHEISVLGRLNGGVTLAAAQAELDAISSELQKQYREYGAVRAAIAPLDSFMVRKVRESMLALLGASGLIVLITCVNVANLLLVRAVRRRRETSLRFAMGASRLRVVRQFLTESMLVAAAGCVAGIVLGGGLMRVLLAMAPANIPRIAGVSMDWRVFAVSTAIATITGALFGIAPAWQASRTRPGEALKSSDRNTASRAQMRWRAALTVAEVALSLMLLIGAGLLIKSFVLLTSVNLGFQPERVLAVNVNLPVTQYRTGDLRLNFYQRLEERVRALPGVESVAFANRMPLSPGWTSGFSTDLQPGTPLDAGFQAVNAGYFDAVGIALQRGRLLTGGDRTGEPPVAVVNDTFARRFLAGRDALSSRFRRGERAPWIQIVGVVKDIRRDGLASEMSPQVYLSAAQPEVYPVRLAELAVRSAGDPHRLLRAIEQQVWEVDKDQPVTNARTLDESVNSSVAQRRFQMLLLLVFAAMAVALSVIGLYGVLSYSVSQRTPELGVRIALGASSREIVGMVLGQAGRLIGAGLAIGLAGSYALTRFVESMLFGVRPHDVPTYLAAMTLLALVAAAASLIPARRGAKLDPMVALRYE